MTRAASLKACASGKSQIAPSDSHAQSAHIIRTVSLSSSARVRPAAQKDTVYAQYLLFNEDAAALHRFPSTSFAAQTAV